LKTLLCIVYAAFTSAAAHAATTGKALPTPNATTALVYYFGFDIDTNAGLHKEQVEEDGCIYTLTKQDFLTSLTSPSKTDAAFNSLDVKAEVKFSTDTSYLIDYDGHVSLKGRRFLIDKKTFVQMLHPVFKGCRK
jgi:hypothetical protein